MNPTESDMPARDAESVRQEALDELTRTAQEWGMYDKVPSRRYDFRFIVCEDCRAMVLEEHERQHADWHWLTNTTIERLAGTQFDGGESA